MSSEFIEFVKKSSLPIVLIGEPCEEDKVHQVLTDNKLGIRDLVKAIAETNKRPNVILHGPLDNREAVDRLEATRDALTEHKLKVATELAGNFQPHLAQTKLTEFLQSGNAPKKFNLICHNDSMAMAAIATLKSQGLKVPKDVAVTGFDDIEFTEFFDLTTVKVPYESLGRQAIDMLMKLLKYEDCKEKILVHPQLIQRGSL
jgi:DNA-binding LacI/PurR family transcriptional regulator